MRKRGVRPSQLCYIGIGVVVGVALHGFIIADRALEQHPPPVAVPVSAAAAVDVVTAASPSPSPSPARPRAPPKTAVKPLQLQSNVDAMDVSGCSAGRRGACAVVVTVRRVVTGGRARDEEVDRWRSPQPVRRHPIPGTCAVTATARQAPHPGGRAAGLRACFSDGEAASVPRVVP
jgi:hypothetical protein